MIPGRNGIGLVAPTKETVDTDPRLSGGVQPHGTNHKVEGWDTLLDEPIPHSLRYGGELRGTANGYSDLVDPSLSPSSQSRLATDERLLMQAAIGQLTIPVHQTDPQYPPPCFKIVLLEQFLAQIYNKVKEIVYAYKIL
ncbi:MAG TPA: hypothetical protein VEB60_00040 [Candidatus Paceibacterota bacterium]|nr:hypothetical protein [Candidatus Paceibacterota bacterium]